MGDLVIKTISIVVIVNGWGSMGNDDKVSCCNIKNRRKMRSTELPFSNRIN